MPTKDAPASMYRTKEGTGLWEHRGKVAVAGIGQAPTMRRWDGVRLLTNGGNLVANNTISLNGGAGVAVLSGSGNAISLNLIFYNGGLGIDLGDPGPQPNDADESDTGANDLQNYPVLLQATPYNKERGLITSDDWADYEFDRSVIKTSVPPQKLSEVFSEFWVGTYVRPKVFMRELQFFVSGNRFRKSMAMQFIKMGREMSSDVKKMKGEEELGF